MKLDMKRLEEIFNSKNKNYGNAWDKIGDIFRILFPSGIYLGNKDAYVIMGFLYAILEKYIRFTTMWNYGLTSSEPMEDSLDDISITSQMLKEFLISVKEESNEQKNSIQ